MKQLQYLIAALLFLGLASCTSSPKGEKEEGKAEGILEAAAADNTLSDREKEEGWVLLFDGKTTNGWREFDGEAFPDTGWYIDDGMLVCENSGKGEAGFGGDIIYDKQFTNFDLKLDWMIEEGRRSGIRLLNTRSWIISQTILTIRSGRTGTAGPAACTT
jgi:hypothetical protein